MEVRRDFLDEIARFRVLLTSINEGQGFLAAFSHFRHAKASLWGVAELEPLEAWF